MISINEKIKRINYLAKELDVIYHQTARKFGMSDSVLTVLYMIYEKGDGCLLHDICCESGISKQTINSAMRKLENEDVLYLEQDKGKKKRVFLTEKGKGYIENTVVRLYEAECRVLSAWTEDEFKLYMKFMKRYNDLLKAEVEKMEG